MSGAGKEPAPGPNQGARKKGKRDVKARGHPPTEDRPIAYTLVAVLVVLAGEWKKGNRLSFLAPLVLERLTSGKAI